MAPTRHRETGPAAASPHAALSHSRGCDRDGGSRERGRGRPLKRQQLRCGGATGAKGQGRGGSPLGRKVAQGSLARGEESLSPQMGLNLFPTSVFANACHFLLCQCLPAHVLHGSAGGPSLGVPPPAGTKGFPEGDSRRRQWILLSLKHEFKEWMGIKTPQHTVLQARRCRGLHGGWGETLQVKHTGCL